MSIAVRKRQLRQQYAHRRSALSAEFRRQASRCIGEKLIQLIAQRGYACIASYSSIGAEVDLRMLHEHLLATGLTLALPKVQGADRMGFHQVSNLASLQSGFAGIAEPPSAARLLQMPDLIIVPGLAFDRNRYRLGQGGGYYDRYLADLPQLPPLAGVSYRSCLHDTELPRAPHDVRMDVIVTETLVVGGIDQWELSL